MRRGIQRRVILLYVVLVLLAMTLVRFYLLDRLEKYYLAEAAANLARNASFMAGRLGAELSSAEVEEAYLQELLPQFTRSEDTVVLLLGPDGTVYSGSKSTAAMELRGKNLLTRDVVVKALAGEASAGALFEDDGGIRYWTTAVPLAGTLKIGDQTVKVAALYLQEPLTRTYKILADVQDYLRNATVFAIAVVVVLGSALALTITRPIQEITSRAAKLADGQYDQQIQVRSEDEIGQLARVFNYLTGQLRVTMGAMADEKSRLEAILETMTNGVIAVTREGGLLHINPMAAKMLDLSSIGEAEVAAALENLALGSLEALADRSSSTAIRDKARTVVLGARSLRLHVAPIESNTGGVPAGAVIVLEDVTEQENLDRMRREFVANVSHELKTPLTTIKSYTETLLDGALDSDQAGHFLTVVNDEADRMYGLIRDLLTLSRLDSEQGKFERKPLSIDGVLDDVIESMRVNAEDKEQTLTGDLAPLPSVLGNYERLQQVFFNLVGNAIKYTGRGGHIHVEAREEGPDVVVRVIDNGRGIPDEDLPRIFERFYRVEKGRSRESGGTGLGLAIAQQIVLAHGGDISIHSGVDKGTTVEVRLPAAHPDLPKKYAGDDHVAEG